MEVEKKGKKEKVDREANLNELIDIKGWKALGNKLSTENIKGVVTELESKPVTSVKGKKEVTMGTTIELDVSPKAKKKGNQGDLF